MDITSITQESFITSMSFQLGSNPTEEQIAFLRDFRSPMICFASPGTGKTTSAIMGLINAETYHKIPGANIYALSFTKMATAELATRHHTACMKLGMQQMVNFQTLHSLCSKILKENYRYLGMEKLDTTESTPLEVCVNLLSDYCLSHNILADNRKLRNVVLAVRTLNNSMMFDEQRVTNSMCFKRTKLSYKDFTELRKYLFTYSFLTENIPVDDILLYTLLLFSRAPEVSEEWKKKCKVMVVDEAQDLSLLQLKVVSMLTNNPILIGDMKQQIYGFNGACAEIVEWFRELYPNARETELTQSFRCKNEIADWAAKIIAPSKLDGDTFVGTGDGGSVVLHQDFDLDELARELGKDFLTHNRTFSRDIMFLFRNNASSIPVAEALFKAGVPFRVNKYKPAYEIDVIKDLVDILKLCYDPYNINNIGALRYVIPEFNSYCNVTQNPFYIKCKKDKCSVFEVNYEFRDMGSSSVMMLLLEVSELLHKKAKVPTLFNKLWPVYYENWLRQREWMLEYPKEYYMRIVNPVIHDKDYTQFIQDETAKQKAIEENLRYSRGVRCYTMHAAKGLEADDVYIVDCDEALIPNSKQMLKAIEAHCDLEVATNIRNERALCFVAVTRAKEHVTLCFSSQVAPLLCGENPYDTYDRLYEQYKMNSNDIYAFNSFVEGVGC